MSPTHFNGILCCRQHPSSATAWSVLPAASWQGVQRALEGTSLLPLTLQLGTFQSSPAGAAWAVELNRPEEGEVNGISLNATPWAGWALCLARQPFPGAVLTLEFVPAGPNQQCWRIEMPMVGGKSSLQHCRAGCCFMHPSLVPPLNSWVVPVNGAHCLWLHDVMTPSAPLEYVDLSRQLP